MTRTTIIMRALIAALLLAGATASARAADPAGPREEVAADVGALYAEAMAAMEREDFATAAARFDRAYALRSDVVLLWNAARAHHQAGNLQLARDRYRECLQLDAFPADKRPAAADYLVELELALRAADAADAADATDDRDAKDAPLPDPMLGDVTTPPPEPPAPRDDEAGPGWAPWLVTGLGVALVGVGVGLHFVAESDRDDLRAALRDPPDGVVSSMTQNEAFDREASANTLDTMSVVGIAVGGAAVATGVAWLVIASAGDEEPRADVHVTGSVARDGFGLALSGRF